jgi:hypothetical protein
LQTLELRRRTAGGRRFYVCRAWLDVCGSAEAVCKPHRFDAFFHEDGAFIGYRVAPDRPFTKAEHDPFRQRDYEQLDAILRDPGHALADLPPPRKAARTGESGVAGIDGVTGATIAHYAGQAVPHAFYTSHAVWHLVNRTLPPALRDWTLQWAGPADVRTWVGAGETLKVWWFLDRMEAGAIAPRAAADLAYELLAAKNGHVQAAALRYVRRTATPFRPASCRARDYAAIPDATKPAFLEWWAGEAFTEPALDRALRADLVARAPTRSPVALAILGYLQRIGPRPAAADAWRGALEAFARATPSTYLRAKAQALMAGAGPKDSHKDAEDAERKRKGAEKRRDRITGWTGQGKGGKSHGPTSRVMSRLKLKPSVRRGNRHPPAWPGRAPSPGPAS